MADRLLLEACVDTVGSAMQAARGGADRIELCDNLSDGGTTPSHGTIALALERLAIPVFPIIRPRGGSFVCDADDIAVMRRDARAMRDLGVRGIVIGILTRDGDVDGAAVRAIRDEAPEASVTFHRAFDACRDPAGALETLISLGVDRVLTSGQRATAWEGRADIAAFVRQADGRAVIVAGGAVDETNIGDLLRTTGVREVHVRGTRQHRETVVFHGHPVPFRRALPADESLRPVTDAGRIAAIRAAGVAGEGSVPPAQRGGSSTTTAVP